MSAPKTLYDKIWDNHIVSINDDGTTILYIDRHLVHEVTSPQAFEGLRMSGRKVEDLNLLWLQQTIMCPPWIGIRA